MLIVLDQKREKYGTITNTFLIDVETGEILASDTTLKGSDPIEAGRKALRTMIVDYPGALIHADERFLIGITCEQRVRTTVG
ncbi:hypothetical protein MKZ02_21045 [Pseudobacillus sp. FSL P4-0506]|uniref:hypothetical protein n=1 Tax=Pseudobacillus sp. FSL P4-0506 TaxID=2921576 RepID=UPI0030F6E9B8